MGDWSRARNELEDAAAPVHQGSATPHFLLAATFLGEYYLASGEWDQASRYLEQVTAGAVGRREGRLRHAHGLLAELELYCARPDAARDRLLPLQAAENSFAKWIRTQLAWAYLELDELDRAAELIEWAVMKCREEHHLTRLVDALHVQAMVLARQGQVDRAVAALDEGLTLTPTMPYPYGEARLLRVYGLLHKQRGESEPARERLEAALAIFRRLGRRKDAERTELDLAGLQP